MQEHIIESPVNEKPQTWLLTWDIETWDIETWDIETWDIETWDIETWDIDTWDRQVQRQRKPLHNRGNLSVGRVIVEVLFEASGSRPQCHTHTHT